MKNRRPAIFFDRDGVVNRFPGAGQYVNRRADFHVLPEFVASLRIARERGYAAVVVTNQRGVARGFMTIEALDEIHDALRAELAAAGLALDDIYACTAGDNAHPHRKPNPGMLLDAAARHGLDLSASWMIGDSETDITAGQRAGCRTIRIAPPDAETAATVHLPDMAAARDWLREHLPAAGEGGA